jgi:hypothetical protein
LGGFSERVLAPAGSAFETLAGIVIRLEPGGRYTTTEQDGSFAFYNLPDGGYTASIVKATLPTESQARGSSAATVTMRTGSRTSSVLLEIEPKPVLEKPVRQVLEKIVR